jgi:hypothetical protein
MSLTKNFNSLHLTVSFKTSRKGFSKGSGENGLDEKKEFVILQNQRIADREDLRT